MTDQTLTEIIGLITASAGIIQILVSKHYGTERAHDVKSVVNDSRNDQMSELHLIQGVQKSHGNQLFELEKKIENYHKHSMNSQMKAYEDAMAVASKAIEEGFARHFAKGEPYTKDVTLVPASKTKPAK